MKSEDILTPGQLADRLQVKQSWIYEKCRLREKHSGLPIPVLRVGPLWSRRSYCFWTIFEGNMLKSEIKPRAEHAMRDKRLPGTPFQRVKIIEHVRANKWKAEWIDPNPGLIHYVESGQLIVPWKEHKAFPKEEENEERLWEHNTRHGYKVRSPLIAAVEEVFASVGDDVQFYRGVLGGPAETIDRVKARAGIASGARSPVAYVNRQGSLRLPIDEALEIARKLCATEPTSARSNRSKRTRMGSESPPPGWRISCRSPRRVPGRFGANQTVDRIRSSRCPTGSRNPKTRAPCLGCDLCPSEGWAR